MCKDPPPASTPFWTRNLNKETAFWKQRKKPQNPCTTEGQSDGILSSNPSMAPKPCSAFRYVMLAGSNRSLPRRPSFQHKALKGQIVQPNRTALLFIYHFQDTSTLQVMLLGAQSRPSGSRFYTQLCCSASVGTTPATNDVLSVRTQVSNISAVHKAVNVLKNWVCWKAEREMPEATVSLLYPHLFLDIWANVLKLCCHPNLCRTNRQWNTEKKWINQRKNGIDEKFVETSSNVPTTQIKTLYKFNC